MATYSGLSPLHPKVIEAIFLKKEQGEMFCKQFLPERPVKNPEFTYREYGRVGGMSPYVAEGAPTPLSSVGYQERLAKCLEVREGDLITEQAIKWMEGIRNIVQDTVEHITSRMNLRKEWWIVDRLMQDLTARGEPTAVTPAATWDNASETIIQDLADCITAIQKTGHIKADSLLIGSDEENSIAKADSLIQWNLAGQFGQQQIAEFSVGRLKSLDIYVSDVVIYSDATQEVLDETTEMLITDKGVVFARGNDLGFTAMAEPFTSRQFPVEDRRGIMLQMWQTYIPVITRPTHKVRLLNLHS